MPLSSSRQTDAVSTRDPSSSFIKTPRQLIVVIVLSFVVPIVAIILLVQLVVSRPAADPNAMTDEAIAKRLQPIGRVEFGAAGGAAGSRTGEQVYKAVCTNCHQTGVAGAPKLGDKAAWAPLLSLTDNDEDWYRKHESQARPLAEFGAVLMRKDPPFDLEYVASTWLLSAAAREGARVFNAPQALREHHEKFAIAEFARFTVPSLVAREKIGRAHV